MDDEIRNKFEEIGKRLTKIEKMLFNEDPLKKIERISLGLDQEIKSFCENLEISEEKLRYKIDFQEDIPRLMFELKEVFRTNLQFRALMILGLLYIKIYNKEINAKILNDLFKRSKIPTERFDKLSNSPNFRKYFNKKGGEIKFSWAGEQEAKKEISNLVKND